MSIVSPVVAELLEPALPTTPAGRWELAMRMLHPTHVEPCPHCGQDVEVEGEPLITPEAALQIITGGEEPT